MGEWGRYVCGRRVGGWEGVSKATRLTHVESFHLFVCGMCTVCTQKMGLFFWLATLWCGQRVLKLVNVGALPEKLDFLCVLCIIYTQTKNKEFSRNTCLFKVIPMVA